MGCTDSCLWRPWRSTTSGSPTSTTDAGCECCSSVGAPRFFLGCVRLAMWRVEPLSGILNWLSSGLANVLLTVGFVLLPAVVRLLDPALPAPRRPGHHSPGPSVRRGTRRAAVPRADARRDPAGRPAASRRPAAHRHPEGAWLGLRGVGGRGGRGPLAASPLDGGDRPAVLPRAARRPAGAARSRVRARVGPGGSTAPPSPSRLESGWRCTPSSSP